MVRVEVKNFQSIDHVTVEMDGFTALVGRSNIGKSAVVRAIKAALTGAPVDSFVRHDPRSCPRVTKAAKSCKCFCSVHITAEGFDLLWEKGGPGTVNRYVFNEKTYTAVSKGTPDFLLESFGPAKIGDEKELLQISDQFKPIFILDKTGTVVADMLSDVVKLDQINVASRAVEKDRKEAVATRKVREKDIVELKKAMSDYDGLDAAIARLQEIEEVDRSAQAAQHKLDMIERFLDDVVSAARRVKALDGVGSLVIPEFAPVQAQAEKLTVISRFQAAASDKAETVGHLAGVDNVLVPPTDEFLELGRKFVSLCGWVSKLEGIKKLFERGKSVEGVSVPAIDSSQEAHQTLSKLALWDARHTATTQALDRLTKAVDKAAEEEAEVLSEFDVLGVCPTCSRAFSDDHQHAAVA